MSSQNDRTTDGDKARGDLTVYANSGLCNRLKVLLSGSAIAQTTGRRFAMRWVGHKMPGSFERLFQNEWNVRSDAPLDKRRLIDLTNQPWRTFPDLTQSQDDWLMVQHCDWLIRPAFFPHHAALQAQCAAFMQELKPIPALQERIDAFRDKNFRPRMIGVHLRRGDFHAFHPDVVNNLAATMETVDRWVDEESDAGILLCTDDGAQNLFSHRKMPYEGVVEQFAQRYGERMVTPQARTLDRRQPEATEDALIELWLLRATDRFVGTLGSSFSELVSFDCDMPSVMTATPTPEYASQLRRLKRIGLYGIYSRASRYEYGRVVPYWLLLHRYREHFRAPNPAS